MHFSKYIGCLKGICDSSWGFFAWLVVRGFLSPSSGNIKNSSQVIDVLVTGIPCPGLQFLASLLLFGIFLTYHEA